MDMEKLKSNVMDQVCDINKVMINKLYELLIETFEEENVKEHIEKITDHVKTFYDEVYDELKTRQDHIKTNIEELYQEASELKRLLNVDVKISASTLGTSSLHTVRMNLDESLECLRSKLKQRHDVIRKYLIREQALCEELDKEPRGITTDPLPSELDLAEFDEYLMELSREKIERDAQISQYRKKVHEMLRCLQLTMDREKDYNLLHAETVQPTLSNLEYCRKMMEHFSDQYDQLKYHIDTMRTKLNHLWQYLQEDPATIARFNNYTEYTQSVCDKLFEELQRCETIKRNNIEHFVARTREDIKAMWDKCLKSDIERKSFKIMYSDTFTEDLLSLHELELQDLEQFYEKNESIFKMFEKRKGLFERMQTLEQKAKDPNRYTNRGGQLLKEEKERKEISSTLPIIEAQLIALAKKYNEGTGKCFTVFGVPVDELVENEWEEIRAKKEIISSARKTARDKTPVSKLCVTRTPRTNDMKTSIRKLGVSSASASILKKKATAVASNDVRRCLLKDMNSPLFAKPNATNRSPMKVYNGTSGIKRRSRVKSRSSINKKRKSKGGRAIPVINIESDTPNKAGSAHSTTASYDDFQDYLDNNEPSRSSMIPHQPTPRPKTGHTSKLPTTPIIKKTALTLPRPATAPNSAPSTTRNITIANRTRSPSPGASNRKLTTRNLPIIF